MIEISNMTESDLNEILPILSTEFDEFWSEGVIKSEFKNPNSKYVIAKEDGEIVGFGGIWITPVDVHITDIVTKKKKRNNGIGSKILEKLITISKTTGRESLTLEVNEKNEVAKHLYEKSGFKELGRRKRYYNNTEDALIMTLFFD